MSRQIILILIHPHTPFRLQVTCWRVLAQFRKHTLSTIVPTTSSTFTHNQFRVYQRWQPSSVITRVSTRTPSGKCAQSLPQRPRPPLFTDHRLRRHLFLTWRSHRPPTPPLTPRYLLFRRRPVPAYTRPPPVYTSILLWPRQVCNIICATYLTTPTSTCRQLSSRSPRPARLCRPYPFASLAFRGIAPFGRTPSCRLSTLSSRSKTSLFACTSISERQSRPTSTMP